MKKGMSHGKGKKIPGFGMKLGKGKMGKGAPEGPHGGGLHHK